MIPSGPSHCSALVSRNLKSRGLSNELHNPGLVSPSVMFWLPLIYSILNISHFSKASGVARISISKPFSVVVVEGITLNKLSKSVIMVIEYCSQRHPSR